MAAPYAQGFALSRSRFARASIRSRSSVGADLAVIGNFPRLMTVDTKTHRRVYKAIGWVTLERMPKKCCMACPTEACAGENVSEDLRFVAGTENAFSPTNHSRIARATSAPAPALSPREPFTFLLLNNLQTQVQIL